MYIVMTLPWHHPKRVSFCAGSYACRMLRMTAASAVLSSPSRVGSSGSASRKPELGAGWSVFTRLPVAGSSNWKLCDASKDGRNARDRRGGGINAWVRAYTHCTSRIAVTQWVIGGA